MKQTNKTKRENSISSAKAKQGAKPFQLLESLNGVLAFDFLRLTVNFSPLRLTEC